MSKYVAGAVKALQQERDVKYEIAAIGTIVEADLVRILAVVKKMREETLGT